MEANRGRGDGHRGSLRRAVSSRTRASRAHAFTLNLKSLSSYLTLSAVGPGLQALVRLMLAGKLNVRVGWRADWGLIGEAVLGLRHRQVAGKAILDLPGHSA
jgi:hypothetical protein